MLTLCLKSSKHLVWGLLGIGILATLGCAHDYASTCQELENRNYEAARKQILASYPHDAHYNMLLAEVSYYLEDYDTFVDALSRSLRQSDDYRADLLYLMKLADRELTKKAYDAFTEGDYPTSRRLIDRVLRVRYYLDWVLTPSASRALSVSEMLEYSSESLVNEGRFDEARSRLVHLTADSVRRLNVQERLAFVYYESEQYHHANDLIKNILTPQQGAEGLLLWTDQLRDSDYQTDTVLKVYDSKIRERSLIERPLMDSHLGSSFYMVDDWDNSRFRFERVLLTDPGNAVEFLSLIGESYFLERDYEKAAEAFEGAWVVEPDNEDVVQYLAISRYNLGQKELADSLFAVARTMQQLSIMEPLEYIQPDSTRILLLGGE
ncbi:MAG TPA: hypothetical protein ENH10_06385 [Bacteroidetes bacterium]|nr:tetratricopeptide repeat protein [bacterium BMS3Bbin04]HDO65645.1 hypothetical protein [Bacteroidota bacterium]HEX04770.1 hypothetical protein [Bacteroidota bacterium]